MPAIVLAVLIHEMLNTPIYTDRELSVMREKAVALSNRGQFEAALEQLHALTEVAPRNRAVWGDYLAVLVRAGQDEQALRAYSAHSEREVPGYALAELFDAAVRQRDATLARRLAERDIALNGGSPQMAEARERALIEAGLAPPKIAEPAVAGGSETIAPASAMAPSVATPVSAARRPAAATRKPSLALPVPVAASSVAAPVSTSSPAPGIEQRAPAKTDRLAEEARAAVRAAEAAPAEQRLQRAEEALVALREYELALQAQPSIQPDEAALRNAGLDRVRALTLANRLDEAAAEFEALGEPARLPVFGLLNGADLYARQRRPERAAVLLDEVLRREPAHRAAQQAKFYGEIERRDFAAATATLARLQQTADAAERRDNHLLAATLAVETGRLAEAQKQLEALRAAEPGASDVRLRLGQLYRWRGWPRRALAEYDEALALGDTPAARVGRVTALADMHDFVAARTELDTVAAAAPAHPDMPALRAAERERSRWEYEASVARGRSSGGPVTGDGDRGAEQRLWSPLLAESWRAFVHHRYDWADFPEGAASATRLGIGGAYRSPALDAAFEVHRRRPGDQAGIDIGGEWHSDDRLSLFAEVQSDSASVPLRALNAGIDGHSLAAGAHYRVDENRAARLALSRTEFSDDNTRDSVAASYRQNLYREQERELGLVGQLYYGRNTAGSDVPYFNPAGETAIAATLEYGAPLWRGTQTAWSHRIALGGGVYRQQEYGSNPIWDAEYAQRWRFGRELEISYGALYRSRVYDGGRESYNALFAGVNWRF